MDTNTPTIDLTGARDETTIETWTHYPERLVTSSTGTVHIAIKGRITLCGTRTAVRTAAVGIAPTCRNCGAEPV